MNLGIIIAVSEYTGRLSQLPGCVQDAKAMEAILRNSGKFEPLLVINQDTDSASLKSKLVDFISSNKGKEIEEVFFYYSGHGEYLGDEFYYLLSDYDSSRRKATCLENSELDNLLRSLCPSLTVKVIDACHSGVPYIKDDDSFMAYLKGTEKSFEKCYFMFSSQTDEGSYQDANMSYFTNCFVKAVLEHPSPTIRYKDIIDRISDTFAGDTRQSPFFVTQADFTEVFCSIAQRSRELITEKLEASWSPSSAGESSGTLSPLRDLVAKEASDYCSEGEAMSILNDIAAAFHGFPHPTEASELYEVTSESGVMPPKFPGLDAIGKWLQKNENEFFAEPTIGFFPGRAPSHQPDGFNSTTDMPFDQITIVATPSLEYPNLHGAMCLLVPIISRTHVRFFRAITTLVSDGWDVAANPDPDFRWSTFEFRLKHKEEIQDYVERTVNEFWRFTLDPLKKRFGLVPEDDSEDTSTKDDAAESDNSPETE